MFCTWVYLLSGYIIARLSHLVRLPFFLQVRAPFHASRCVCVCVCERERERESERARARVNIRINLCVCVVYVYTQHKHTHTHTHTHTWCALECRSVLRVWSLSSSDLGLQSYNVCAHAFARAHIHTHTLQVRAVPLRIYLLSFSTGGTANVAQPVPF
jgi:hypothetical protein